MNLLLIAPSVGPSIVRMAVVGETHSHICRSSKQGLFMIPLIGTRIQLNARVAARNGIEARLATRHAVKLEKPDLTANADSDLLVCSIEPGACSCDSLTARSTLDCYPSFR